MRKINVSKMTFLMLVLASYRLTHLVVFDKITEFIREPFMKTQMINDENGELIPKKVPKNKFGYLLSCYWCAGIWSSLILGAFYFFFPRTLKKIIFILSIAGAQTIIETFVGVGTKTIQFLDKKTDTL